MGRNRTALVLWAWFVMGAGAALAVQAETLAELRQRGSLRLAVYNDFPPFSQAGRGIDVDLAQALGERLGLGVELVWFNADEDMNDDLRNMVWKGHYLGGRVADAMLHVPVDPYLAQKNPQVKILAPYHREQMALARDTRRIPRVEDVAGLEAFAHEKIAVELATLPDDFLSTVWNGRLRENVVRYRTAADAVRALAAGEVAAVLAPGSEIEGVLDGTHTHIAVTPFEARSAGLSLTGWVLGLAVKAEATELALALEEAMDALRRDGTVERIFRSHRVTYRAP